MTTNTTNSTDSPLILRSAREGDRKYILATWLNSHAISRTARMIDRPLYFYEQKHVIARLLERSKVVVASNSEEPDHIFGWIVGETPEMLGTAGLARAAIVHYTFTKSDYRELGVAKALVEAIVGDAAKVFFTHLPPAEMAPSRDRTKKPVTPGEVIQRLAPGAVFNPYLTR